MRAGDRAQWWWRSAMRIGLSIAVVAGCSLAVGVSSAPVPVAATPTASFWLQTMDSCKQALAGAAYDLSGGGTTLSVADSTTRGTRVVGIPLRCPLEQGNCSASTTGCLQFTDLPPGTYRIIQTRTPPANPTNPGGYAPCEGGSACRSEVVDVSVAQSGQVSATVTNVYPDGVTVTWPQTGGSYAGTAADPIVVHDFGLGSGSCDGDGDADDHLTGSPSAHCGYPEAEESSVPCHPYPWSCQITGSEGDAQASQSPTSSSTRGGGPGTSARRGVQRTSTLRTTTRRASTRRVSSTQAS
jgi:hypothetical protein